MAFKKGNGEKVRDKFDNRILRVVLTDGGKSIHYLIQSQLKESDVILKHKLTQKQKRPL